MKIFLAIIALIPLGIWAQSPKMSVKSQYDILFIQQQTEKIVKGNATLFRELPLMRINQEIFVSFLGKIDPSQAISNQEWLRVGNGTNSVRSVRVRIDALPLIHTITGFSQIELAGKIQPLVERAKYDTRADSVHQGLHLPQNYAGRNVLIGFNDWGFDYTHPVFYDTTQQQSRIFAVWDQFKQSGPHPTNFSYGAEYLTSTTILAAQSDTTNQLNHSTHGTHVAGIAGGAGFGPMGKGLAYESNLIFTTLLLDEAAVIDSWEWMRDLAVSANKNLVVNMSWGVYHFGTNDGTSLLSLALNEFSDQGVLFVGAAGNNGNMNFHLQKDFNNDSVRTKVAYFSPSVHDSLWGQSLHAWGEVGKEFEIKLSIVNFSNVTLAETGYFSSNMNAFHDGSFAINNDSMSFNVLGQSAHPSNGRPTMRFRISTPPLGFKIIMTARAEDGTVHFWNLVELSTNGGNWGQNFEQDGVGTVGGDVFYGVGEPSCAEACFTIASHLPRYYFNPTSMTGGEISSFSSYGPLYSGLMKPDISAPGSSILSAINSFTTDGYNSAGNAVFNGTTYHFARLSGTSMAAPVVAGICALVWEANPNLTPQQVKELLMSTARTDNYTGAIPSEGSTRWGAGKIQVSLAIYTALGILGLQENYSKEDLEWQVVPNPTNQELAIIGLQNLEKATLYDLTGKAHELNVNASSWNVEDFSAGVYLLKVISNGKAYQKKVVVL